VIFLEDWWSVTMMPLSWPKLQKKESNKMKIGTIRAGFILKEKRFLGIKIQISGHRFI
jgi:hypothetical protein